MSAKVWAIVEIRLLLGTPAFEATDGSVLPEDSSLCRVAVLMPRSLATAASTLCSIGFCEPDWVPVVLGPLLAELSRLVADGSKLTDMAPFRAFAHSV